MTKTIEVEVDVDDILDDLSDDEVIAEVEARGYEIFSRDDNEMERIRSLISRGEAHEALLAMERYLFPKWPSVSASEAQYRSVKDGK